VTARHRLGPWLCAAICLASAAACRRSPVTPARQDAGAAAAKDVLCWQESHGCVSCVGREGESPFLEAEQSRPTLCDPRDPENCVEFCSALAPDCALSWKQSAPCVFDSELAFRRALFDRDAADRPEVVLAGRVIDEAGKRVEGAQVRVWLSWRNQLTHLHDGASGRDGTFKVPLRAGPWSYALRISHGGLASEIVERLAPERLDRAGGPRTFRLAPENVIRGRVVHATTGAGVVGATVVAARSAEDALPVSEARTAEDGSFSLGGLEPRRYFLRVSSFGWRPATLKNAVTAPAARLTVKLEPTNVIRGVVRDSHGEPVGNALVAAVFSGVPGAPTLPYTWTTDADGRFAEDRFTAGIGYLWARRGDMFVYPPEKVELAQSQEVEVALTLRHQGARITGKVRSAHGRPLGPDSRAVLLSRSPLAFPRPAVGELDGEGAFVIVGVLPGRYEISIRDGSRPMGIVGGPRDVEVPIEPDSAVALPEPVLVRPQLSTE
jgi:protocatechuate 3,4-dioxygenase beta subunit